MERTLRNPTCAHVRANNMEMQQYLSDPKHQPKKWKVMKIKLSATLVEEKPEKAAISINQ